MRRRKSPARNRPFPPSQHGQAPAPLLFSFPTPRIFGIPRPLATTAGVLSGAGILPYNSLNARWRATFVWIRKPR